MKVKRKTLTAYLLLLSVLFVTGISNENPSWHWTWSCVDGTCSRSASPNERNGTSLNVCRLLCGKYGSLWPMPTGKTELGNRLYFFHPSQIKFDYSNVAGGEPVKEYMYRISKIFQNKLYNNCGERCNFVPETEININFKVILSDVALNWETDESYTLDISERETRFAEDNVTVIDVKIKSTSVYGSRHALETLIQLTTWHQQTSRTDRSRSMVVISSAQIIDSPAFPHRGLVLDTARHYLPVDTIYKTLDAMAMTKLNVLHWHVTDSQSFPLETPRVPQLLRYGAYSSDQIYTVADTKAIVDYARHRGIRILMEIDGPAHAGNGWQWGEDSNFGKLALCVNQQPWRRYCIQPPCGQLNPVNPNLYDILGKVFADVIEMLPPGEAFHMGGDEVFFPCWNSSAEVVEWMANNYPGRTEEDFLNLWGSYQDNVLTAFSERNPVQDVPVVLWSSSLTEPSVIEKYLDKNRYVIETWLEASSPVPQQLLNKGYKLILSTKDKWYLDHGFWGTTTYHSWKVAYNNKLPKHANVLGGEAAMWSERVDQHSLDVKVWPRTAAVAERLWTNPASGAKDAEDRFECFRERLIENGIHADAVSPYYCYQNEKECH